MANLSIQEKMDYAMQAFGSVGIGREATLGILGSLAGESGRNLNPNAVNSKSGATGVAQHLGSRLTAMDKFESKWGNNRDFRHQIDFMVHELKTTEKRTANQLKQEGVTRAKASDIWTKSFERPAKHEQKLEARRDNANHFAKTMDKALTDIALPTVGPTPQSRSSALAKAEPDLVEPQAIQQAAMPPSVNAFAAAPPAETVAKNAESKAVAAQPEAKAFDMDRFGVAPEPTMSVALRDPTPAEVQERAAQVAQVAPFDMDRFAPNEPTRTVSPEARTALGYTDAKLADPAAAINAVAPTQSLAAIQQPTNYVDPQVNAQGAKSASQQTSQRSSNTAGAAATQAQPTQSLWDGLTEAISGVANGVTGAVTNLSNGNVHGAFASMPGGPTQKSEQVAAQAESKAAAAAPAKGGIEGFLTGETSVMAAVGAIAGGVFAGAPGAVMGGLLGQGINVAMEGITGTKNQSADSLFNKAEDGLKGAIDGLFGNIGGKSNAADKAAGMPSGGWGVNDFPNAPNAPANSTPWDGTYSGDVFDSLTGAEQEAVSSTPGLY